MTTSFETVIIGAGPAGLACAAHLAGNGHNVLVLEKNSSLGPKVCAGGITWSGLTGHVPGTLVERSFNAQVIRTRRQHFTLHSDCPMVSTVRRDRLGEWMANDAMAKGARIETSARVLSLTDSFLLVKRKDNVEQKISFDLLVGADGSHSLVRRHLGLSTRAGIGIHYLVPGRFDRMEWHLNPSLFGNGYGWIFPYNDHASVGAYKIPAPGKEQETGWWLHRSLKTWCARNAINLTGLTPRAGHISCGFQGIRFQKKIFLVGDAAGLASGLTGEGILPAIVSGKAVADEIMGKNDAATVLRPLLQRQQLHHRVLRLTGTNPLLNFLVMESLALGLRCRLVPFSALEMG